MNKQQGISAYIALFIVLTAIIALYILPILNLSNETGGETEIGQIAMSFKGKDLSAIFHTEDNGTDLSTNIYAYIVNILYEAFSAVSYTFLLRLPSALIIAVLALCLFRFDGTYANLNASFLSALIFMTTALVNVVCFTAVPLTIPALLLIVSLISLYHWNRRSGGRNSLLLMLSTTCLTIVTGYMGLSLIAILGVFFNLSKHVNRTRNILIFAGVIFLALTSSIITIWLISGDVNTTINVFLSSWLKGSFGANSNILYVFAYFIFISLLPWSIPILINSIWYIKHSKVLVAKFNSLQLLQRFGVIVFFVSLPTFFFASKFSFILLLATIFFNMPLISKTLLSQLNNNPLVWRITGISIASIASIGICCYIYVNSGGTIPFITPYFHATGWSLWNSILTALIIVGIYTLWRNHKTITENRRYFYNIIWLYLLVQNLFIGFIIDNITV